MFIAPRRLPVPEKGFTVASPRDSTTIPAACAVILFLLRELFTARSPVAFDNRDLLFCGYCEATAVDKPVNNFGYNFGDKLGGLVSPSDEDLQSEVLRYIERPLLSLSEYGLWMFHVKPKTVRDADSQQNRPSYPVLGPVRLIMGRFSRAP